MFFGIIRGVKLAKIAEWLDNALCVADFDDVSNNGLQLARAHGEVRRAAVAVDASLRAVEVAAESEADLLIVHHGISWGGGIRRIDGGIYRVVKAAIDADIAIYACHLPLDAHPVLGNNAGLARELGLKKLRKAFCYHGNVIGFVGTDPAGRKIGVCSGGAGEFAEEAKRLGCDEYVTGEASWGDVVAAQNAGIKMTCLGHYETEVYGVRAVAAAMRKALKIQVDDLTEVLK